MAEKKATLENIDKADDLPFFCHHQVGAREKLAPINFDLEELFAK